MERFNKGIRVTHRWLSIVFTGTVIANIVALVLHSSATWIGLTALAPLIPMLVTGLYMFFLPYAARRRGGGAVAEGARP
ncbi:MAG TPA: hypothetical protein VG939_00325 [Caulobacteraceae bacterium]|nr:hypothetical protein [Caulobacteraceae bacterium]